MKSGNPQGGPSNKLSLAMEKKSFLSVYGRSYG